MRVAVVGSGVAGLAAARALVQSGAEVVLYEKETVVVGGGVPSLRINHNGGDLNTSYPNMITYFEELGLEAEAWNMSFSLSLREKVLEWSNAGFGGLFAQKQNLLDPFFWNLMREIWKFSIDVPRYLQRVEGSETGINPKETLCEFLDSHGYSKNFREDYLIPICASIWSCSSELVLTLSASTVLTVCTDQNLLQLSGVSQWLTIKGGLEAYVEKVVEELKVAGAKIRISTLVTKIKPLDSGSVQLEENNGGVDTFDQCIVATNALDALQMRGEDATLSERNVLGAFKYVDCDIYLHHDEAFMPKSRAAWSASNFMEDISGGVCVTHWLNLIQNFGHEGLPFLITLNPPTVPQHVEKRWRRSQPVPTPQASAAAKLLGSIQGRHGVWYCGSYQGFGSSLSGDALKYGLEIANALLGKTFEAPRLVNRRGLSWSEYAAKRSVLSVFKHIVRTGNLRVVEVGGSILDFIGTEKGRNLKCVLQINNPAFYWKIATKYDLGLADAYIDGDFSFSGDRKQNNLCNFIEFIIENMELAKSQTDIKTSSIHRAWWEPLFVTATVGTAISYISYLLRDNSITKSRQNISDHYDMSNEMFSLFLGETMAYSCGIFKGPGDTLKNAQIRKLHILIEKARIKSTHEVLEIGFGWGSLAIELVRLTGCRYTGLSLSIEQLKFTQRRVKEAALEDHITLLLCDYRVLPEPHKFDRIIACEMFEHVGHNYQKLFFDRCDYLLAKDGLVVFQFSATPDQTYDSSRRSGGFVNERIFPGVNLPCLSVFSTAAASKFSVEHMDNIGQHYYQTLMCWQENFLANSSEIKRLGFDDKFIRKMVYYFSFCAAGFKTRVASVIQVVLSRPGNVATLGSPLMCFPSLF
ncbi:unnamed protein product [Calypogeia fissa]